LNEVLGNQPSDEKPEEWLNSGDKPDRLQIEPPHCSLCDLGEHFERIEMYLEDHPNAEFWGN
jgi:hypothetical protein